MKPHNPFVRVGFDDHGLHRTKSRTRGVPEPKQERSRVTRDAILQAARRILSEGGVVALTLTRIAKVAGVSPGTLYNRFPLGKEDICAALLDKTCADYYVVLCKEVAATVGVPLAEAIPRVVTAMVEEMCRAPLLHSGLVSLLPPIQRHIYDDYVEKHVQAVAAFLSTSEPMRPRAAVAAFILVHAADGVGQAIAREAPDRTRIRVLTQELIDLAMYYLQQKPEGIAALRRGQSESTKAPRSVRV